MMKNLHITKIASTFTARWKSLLGITGILLLSLLVVSCASDDDDTDAATYTVGGTISGQTGEVTLSLTATGVLEDLTIADDATEFTFLAKFEKDADYIVAVKTNPDSQTCEVTGGTGKVAEANVTSVKVTCQ